MLKGNIIFKTYTAIRKCLPNELWKSVLRLFPITLLTNFFELISVLLLFPSIQLLLTPTMISSDGYVGSFFRALHITNDKTAFLFCFGTLLTLFVLKNLAMYFAIRKQTNLQFTIATEIVLLRFQSYLLKNHDFYTENNIAVLLRNVTQIPYEFVSFVLTPFVNIINELIILFILSAVILIFNPILFVSILTFSIPVIYFYNRYYKIELEEISKKRDMYGAEQYKMALQSLENFTEIKIFQKEDFFLPLFRSHTKEFEKSMSKSTILNLFSPKIIETVAISSIFLVVVVGVITNQSAAELVSFLLLFAVGAFRIIPSLNKITLSINYIKGSSHVFNHLDISDSREVVKSRKTPEITPPLEFERVITIDDLSFGYIPNNRVLKNINLSIQKGEKIAIIGESGSGKSTFLSILLRFYQETQGNIYVDGITLTDANKLQWYNLISYVPQYVQLISGSVAQNIAFGEDDEMIDLIRVQQIVDSLHLKGFVAGLEKGLHTSLGENNANISGGQKQRLGIARALYHKRQIILLDEATSALDTETEQNVVKEIVSLNNITVIFITHRVNTLIQFDKVFELKKGHFIQQSL